MSSQTQRQDSRQIIRSLLALSAAAFGISTAPHASTGGPAIDRSP
ncbi:hypothetical protein HNP55_004222 [Paucibacter oligotrophus]|uniref:Uncharacterized protein n=1 Tax=Roseateles oligotrophus TaxID=1769250 RepID=A0A840LBY5_9BURK|nr:hypothetical protein [Roseateles oligotrophus]MBB4845670.1 hypothetical protein [Roseateles oligotrophus]